MHARVLLRQLRVAAGAAGAAACAFGAHECTARSAAAPTDFDGLVRARKPERATDLPCGHDESWLTSRRDGHLMWQTLRSEGTLRRVAMWSWFGDGEDSAAAAAGDKPTTKAGLSRVGAVVELGDRLNGHTGLVHGGYSASLIDDLLGWAAGAEREAQLLPRGTRVFTANLNVNYRRPMPHEAVYYVQAEAERLEKGKKLFMKAAIYDARGALIADATSLYILVKPPPPAVEEVRRADAPAAGAALAVDAEPAPAAASPVDVPPQFAPR